MPIRNGLRLKILAKSFFGSAQCFFSSLARGDHLREEDQPADLTITFAPGKTFPLQPPCTTVRRYVWIFFASFDCAREDPAMNFFPAIGKIRKYFVVRFADDVLSFEMIVSEKTVADLEVAHFCIEHRDRGRRVSDEQPKQSFIGLHSLFDAHVQHLKGH